MTQRHKTCWAHLSCRDAHKSQRTACHKPDRKSDILDWSGDLAPNSRWCLLLVTVDATWTHLQWKYTGLILNSGTQDVLVSGDSTLIKTFKIISPNFMTWDIWLWLLHKLCSGLLVIIYQENKHIYNQCPFYFCKTGNEEKQHTAGWTIISYNIPAFLILYLLSSAVEGCY